MASWNPMTSLRNLARNSPWVVMAIALHLILIAVATIFYTSHSETRVVDRGITIRNEPKREPPPETVEEPLKVRQEIPLAPDDTELVKLDEYVPSNQPASTVDDPIGDPDSTVDAPSDIPPASSAIGPGHIGGRASRVSPYSGRPTNLVGPGRPDGTGTKPKSPLDERILQGLAWLARHQDEDGSWSALRLHERCDAGQSCAPRDVSYVASYDEGLTGLAVLAFLGAGVRPGSTAYFKDEGRSDQKIVAGDVVKHGLKWLCEHQNDDGSFGKERPFLYNQALATMALAEAYGMTGVRYYKERAQRAVDFLQAAQRPSPTGNGLWGWRYAARQEIERFHQGDSLDEAFRREIYDADTSVTGWAVMALKSAQMSGLRVNPENMAGALAFARWCSTPDGLTGYIDPKGAGAKVTGPDDHFEYHPAGMSALSMCIRAFTAHDPNDAFLEPAAKRLAADLPRVGKDKLTIDYYYWYYGSLALFQFDGPDAPRNGERYWRPWNKATLDALLDLQTSRGKDCRLGGWLVPDRWCHSGGPIYATAINVLTLEVTYRYPNAFSMGRKAAKPSDVEPPQGAK